MSKIILDCEADGLLDEVTKVHCIVLRDEDENIFKLYEDSLTRKNLLNILNNYKIIICHNILRYDSILIKKFFNISLVRGWELIDTLVWSKALYPDRSLPEGCPTSLLNPVTNRKQIITPHGLEAWGYRVGFKKPGIYDWREFNEEMLHRCEQDTLINLLTYKELCKEANLKTIQAIRYKRYDNEEIVN
ncbi:MAG: hypothetical protein GTO02_15875 [Candidatus Dadabacteria bacterium]|nr:hypothetical protein [Candidatus Dadabacteria bacterium]